MEESGNLLLGEVWLPHLLGRSGGYIHLGALLLLAGLQPVAVHLLLALLAQPRNLQAVLIMTKMVFTANSDDCSLYGWTDKLDHPATPLADEVFMMDPTPHHFIMAVLVPMLDLAQCAYLNQCRNQSGYG